MATNATIVDRLNELIVTKGGDEKGTTISQCLGIINELEGAEAASLQSVENQADAQEQAESEAQTDGE